MANTFTIVTADHRIIETTASGYRTILRDTASALGCTPYVFVSGTHAVAYCTSRRCAGHLVARVFDNYRPNDTTAANRAAAIALATASATYEKEAGNVQG
jgi:hypothetical protein